jgi:hypothetical protein
MLLLGELSHVNFYYPRYKLRAANHSTVFLEISVENFGQKVAELGPRSFVSFLVVDSLLWHVCTHSGERMIAVLIHYDLAVDFCSADFLLERLKLLRWDEGIQATVKHNHWTLFGKWIV